MKAPAEHFSINHNQANTLLPILHKNVRSQLILLLLITFEFLHLELIKNASISLRHLLVRTHLFVKYLYVFLQNKLATHTGFHRTRQMLILFVNRLPEMLNRICLMHCPSNCRLSLFWEAVLWPQLAFLAFRLSVLWYISRVVSSYVRIYAFLSFLQSKKTCIMLLLEFFNGWMFPFFLFFFVSAHRWWMRNARCLCELKNGFDSSEKWKGKVNEF